MSDVHQTVSRKLKYMYIYIGNLEHATLRRCTCQRKCSDTHRTYFNIPNLECICTFIRSIKWGIVGCLNENQSIRSRCLERIAVCCRGSSFLPSSAVLMLVQYIESSCTCTVFGPAHHHHHHHIIINQSSALRIDGRVRQRQMHVFKLRWVHE